MDPSSLTDMMSLLNQQIATQEALANYLHKAKALTTVTLGINFLEYDNVTLHDYLWTLSDLIEDASILSEEILKDSSRKATFCLLNMKKAQPYP